jgi:hypothetical protein
MSEKKSWIVRMEVTVLRDVICEGCTREQAEGNPFEYAIEETTDLDTKDWEVISVKENV